MTNYQKLYSNGTWYDIDQDQVNENLEHILKYEQHLKTFVDTDALGRDLLSTIDEITEYLDTGKLLDYDSDWYNQIRKTPAPIVQNDVMVKCACGHTVLKNIVMNASLGTCCPECYDRMSA